MSAINGGRFDFWGKVGLVLHFQKRIMVLVTLIKNPVPLENYLLLFFALISTYYSARRHFLRFVFS